MEKKEALITPTPQHSDTAFSSPDTRLTRAQRITASSIFREAFADGLHYAGKFVVLWLRRGEGAKLRLGVVASKRSFRKAVERSRAKRLLREAYRLNRFRLHGDYDVILVARRSILKMSRQAVERELLKLAENAGILKNAECHVGPLAQVATWRS